MSYGEPVRTTTRRIPGILVAGLLVAIAATIGVLAHRSAASSSSATSPLAAEPLPHRLHESLPGNDRAAAGEADGVVPDGVTVFDDRYPAVTNLNPALRRALRQAATDAARDGVTLYVDSGWRSAKYQEQLFDEAVAKYGSKEKAAKWVATPSTSAHVSGDAVDIGHVAATAWLRTHGAEYGLCQIYGNEPWHFELRPEAIDRGCPGMYADPTRDPRMHR
jgi:D-alanyl-D-alanine carboxypeptidase